jgi:hypothetical protein
MSKGIRLKGKWFWLICTRLDCGWRGQSDRHYKKCPRCGQASVTKEGRLAVSAEVEVSVEGA